MAGFDRNQVADIIRNARPTSSESAMRIDPETLSRVDEWRRKRADLLSRAEAIRRLVELGLKAKGGKR